MSWLLVRVRQEAQSVWLDVLPYREVQATKEAKHLAGNYAPWKLAGLHLFIHRFVYNAEMVYLCVNMSKNLYIIAGCNGAGKTTASFTILPEIWHCNEFVNADEIARGLSPFNPESVAMQAGRIMLERIEMLLEQGRTFSIETTLATRSYVQLVKRAQAKGYTVNLLFFWLNSPEVAIQRVAKRVSEGGHNIPTEVICRRYQLGLSNFFHLYKDIVDTWTLVDNASNPRQIVATDDEIFNVELYNTIESYVKG